MAPPGRGNAASCSLSFLLALAILCGDLGRVWASEGGGAAMMEPEDRRSRGTWAALLLGYVALGAVATGAAYLLRDSVFGRSVAVSAAGWGGLGLGAGAGYGLSHLRGCESADCSTGEQVAISLGGLLGGIAGTIAGDVLTSQPGMSRPYTTAAGVAPVLVFFTMGTILEW